MRTIRRVLTFFADNRYLSLAAGIVLLVTSGIEIIRSFDGGQVGARHGIFVYALVQILQSLPGIVFGAKDIVAGESEESVAR